MLGETIKNPLNNVHDCFADTCIYIDYGLDFNYYNGAAQKFFNSAHKRYTSDSVDIEIRYFKDFTTQFGGQLENALTNRKRKDVINYPRTVFRRFNDSRWDLIGDIIKKIKNHDAEGMTSEYRAFKKLVWARIDDAKSKTNNPFEKQSNDKKFIDSLSYINDPYDQQIIADAALWAASYEYAVFCTADREHILSNESKLTPHIATYLGKKCLSFKHVKDVVT
jgi:hypothetical protein